MPYMGTVGPPPGAVRANTENLLNQPHCLQEQRMLLVLTMDVQQNLDTVSLAGA